MSAPGPVTEPPAGSPAVSVVVATRQRARRLGRLLASLRAQSLAPGKFEVIVVDDGSSDATPATLDEAAREGDLTLRTIRRAVPGGPSAARNAGWRVSRAPLVAFTDDDCVAHPDWLSKGLEAARSAPGAIVQGRTDPDPAEAMLLGPFSRSLWVDRLGPYYQACNIFYPRAVLEQLGGFDAEAFPSVGEDTDLAWRAIRSGVAPIFAPDARVFHAVERLGPIGMLRAATRWTPSIRLFRRHPQLRPVHLDGGVFWKGSHRLLVKALLGLVLPRRLVALSFMLGMPYGMHLLERGRIDGGGPAAAPYYALYDLVELVAVTRGAVRFRTLVI